MRRKKGQGCPIFVPTEDQEQIALVKWLQLNNILHFHIPNGAFKTISQAVRFKKLGLKAGVPDIFIPVPRGKYHGLFIELKRTAKYTISPTQKWWLERLSKAGYFAIVAKGFDAAKNIIRNYLENLPIEIDFEDVLF